MTHTKLTVQRPQIHSGRPASRRNIEQITTINSPTSPDISETASGVHDATIGQFSNTVTLLVNTCTLRTDISPELTFLFSPSSFSTLYLFLSPSIYLPFSPRLSPGRTLIMFVCSCVVYLSCDLASSLPLFPKLICNL